jgi:hypothetical protein
VVQFCNLNQYDQNYGGRSMIQSIIDDGTINRSKYDQPGNYVEAVNDYFRAQVIRRSLNNEFNLLLLSFDINQMLFSCRFKDEPCSRDDFMEYFDYYYGLCYRFNQGRNLTGYPTPISKLGLAGIKNGLQLELYAGHAKTQEKYILTRGFRILVFNKSEVNQMAQDVGIDIPTGFSTNIEVQRIFTHHLSSSYGICQPTEISKVNWNQNDVLKFMNEYFIEDSYYKPIDSTSWRGPPWNWTINYSQLFCLKMCFMKYVYENCGCYDITVPLTPKLQDTYLKNACISGEQLNCLNRKQNYFYSEVELFGPCYKKCPIECDYVKYDLKVTQATYPTEWYAEFLNNSTYFNEVINMYFSTLNATPLSYKGNYTGLRNSVARVNVYYEDLSYVVISESPAMTFDLFLGNLGGNLGLFLGKKIFD